VSDRKDNRYERREPIPSVAGVAFRCTVVSGNRRNLLQRSRLSRPHDRNDFARQLAVDYRTSLTLRRPFQLLRWVTWLLLLAESVAFTCLAQTPATYQARADQALQSFLLKFWNGGQQYLRNKFPDDGSLTGYWTYAHGWEALLDGVERTGGQQYAGLIESFYLGQFQRGWLDGYYDDECWMTMAAVRAYDLTGTQKYLDAAVYLYTDITNAWDTTCCGAITGGLWWDKAHTQKATAANAGAALAGARLYSRTGNSAFLAFAQQAYSWWYANMVDAASYQVCDHINTDGTKVWWRFTYNEGLMIGASLALYDATADPGYLAKAHNIAGYMIAHEVIASAYGPVLYDGDNSGCGGDCHEFKGPAYRYLMQLYARDTSRAGYSNVLRASVDAIWNLARDPSATTFSVNWAGPSQTNVDEAQDNAACIALSRFAQQSGNYPGSGLPPNQYEAENATLHNLGLEATYGSFTGWGYVAAWNGDNQWVDFNVNFPTAGGRTLTFRYAAGAGNATRLITINGNNVITNQSFPDTGSWSGYSTVNVSYSFPPGPSTISVKFDSTMGNANFLNLDNMAVTDLQITGLAVSSPGVVQLTWNAVSGLTYRVQYSSALASCFWSNLGSSITATGSIAAGTDSLGNNSARYYRVVTQ
jgi:predicted alpha-1,6-mannanase (GH76 family)